MMVTNTLCTMGSTKCHDLVPCSLCSLVGECKRWRLFCCFLNILGLVLHVTIPLRRLLLYRIVWIKTSHQLVNHVLQWSVQAEWLSLIITSRLLEKDLVDFTTVQTPDWIFSLLWRTADSALEGIHILVWSVWGENQCDIREPVLWPPQ
jgi:hypothetical protein